MAEHLILDGREQGHKALILPKSMDRILVVKSVCLLPGQSELGWDLPGGRQEVGESPMDVLEREIREEVPGCERAVDLTRARWIGSQVINRPGKPDVVRNVWMASANARNRYWQTKWVEFGDRGFNLDPLLSKFFVEQHDAILAGIEALSQETPPQAIRT